MTGAQRPDIPASTRIPRGQLAALACLLEVSARKAGNVHPGSDFEDACSTDFLASALAVGPPLDHVEQTGVGRAVLQAVQASRGLVSVNTNLGMILLLAPLAAARDQDLNEPGMAGLLDRLTVEDTRAVYQAIRLANPGGLGSAAEQDVAAEPSLPLRQVMRLAADRDLVARQYRDAFADVFGPGLRFLQDGLSRGRGLEEAIVGTHLEMLARFGDSLIARKRGAGVSNEASRRAREVLEAGWPAEPAGRLAFQTLDEWLRADGHARNPGATADLTAAVIYVGLRLGWIRLPFGPGQWSGRR